MCTRYITPDRRVVEDYLAHVPDWWRARYDIHIADHVPVIRAQADGTLAAEQMYWTLLAQRFESKRAWRFPTFNLRAERLDESRLYAPAFAERRCVLPAAGFYEWPLVDARKLRYCIQPARAPLFFFAGLWNPWQASAGDETDRTCGIVTCPANATMRPLSNAGNNRHRMPVILDWRGAHAWLLGMRDKARALAAPCPDDWLTSHPVARNLGDVAQQMAPIDAGTGRTAQLPF